MKLPLKILSLLVFAFILLNGCQKDFTEEDLDPPVLTGDSTYLDKFMLLDSSATGIDTAHLFVYEYDVNKRVTSLKNYWEEDSGMMLGIEIRYHYSGNDTMPFSSIRHEYDYDNGIVSSKDTTHTFYYFQNGKLVRDSSIYYFVYTNQSGQLVGVTDTLKQSYTYSGNTVYAFRWEYEGDRFGPPGNGGVWIIKDTANLDINGNLISSRAYESGDLGNTWNFFYACNFTYDNKNSPFSRLSNFRTLYAVPPVEGFYYEMQNVNNRVSEHYDYDNYSLDHDFGNNFTYRPDGLITSVRYIEPGSSSTMIIKYFYKSL